MTIAEYVRGPVKELSAIRTSDPKLLSAFKPANPNKERVFGCIHDILDLDAGETPTDHTPTR